MLIVDQAKLKNWLDIDTSDDDQLLTDLEARVVAYIEEQTNRRFEPGLQQETDYFDGVQDIVGTDASYIWLTRQPKGTLTIEQRSGMADSWDTIPTAEWEQDGRKIYFTANATTPDGTRTIKATYDYGFDQNSDVPGDIVQLIYDLIAVKYNQRTREGFERTKWDDISVTLGDLQQVPGAMQTIEDYTRSNLRVSGI